MTRASQPPVRAATCPAKIMLAGEYDVLEGGPAILIAVNRMARATLANAPRKQPLFLETLRQRLIEREGQDSLAALAAARIVVDTNAFQDGGNKLGLGSSAAAMVSATALCLGQQGDSLDLTRVLQVATIAHGDAQLTLGARGSGADLACCCLGGAIEFQRDQGATSITLPADLVLVFPWANRPASTAKLVAAVEAFARAEPAAHRVLTQRIREVSRALSAATSASQAILAIRAGAEAIADLSRASNALLWLPLHTQMAERARALGGGLKTTGAGGGDLAVAAFTNQAAAEQFREQMRGLGILCPTLSVERQGVRLQA